MHRQRQRSVTLLQTKDRQQHQKLDPADIWTWGAGLLVLGEDKHPFFQARSRTLLQQPQEPV